MSGKIDEITKGIQEKYGIDIKISLIGKGKKERWTFETIDKLTKENSKKIDEAKNYAAERLARCQYQELFDRTKSDLRACKVLYDDGLYPESIYHLQQSVEKVHKALAIMKNWEPFTENDFRKKMGHDTLKYYKNIVIPAAKEIKTPFNKFVKEQFGQTNTELDSIDSFRSLIEDLEKEDDENLISMDIENLLQNTIKKYNDLEDQKNKMVWEQLRQNLIKTIYFHNPRAEIDPIKVDGLRNINDVEILLREMITKDYQIITYLLPLSIITLPHEAYTRYPKVDLSITPKIYTKTLSVVKTLPKLIDIQSKVLEDLEKIDKLSKEFRDKIK